MIISNWFCIVLTQLSNKRLSLICTASFSAFIVCRTVIELFCQEVSVCWVGRGGSLLISFRGAISSGLLGYVWRGGLLLKKDQDCKIFAQLNDSPAKPNKSREKQYKWGSTSYWYNELKRWQNQFRYNHTCGRIWNTALSFDIKPSKSSPRGRTQTNPWQNHGPGNSNWQSI